MWGHNKFLLQSRENALFNSVMIMCLHGYLSSTHKVLFYTSYRQEKVTRKSSNGFLLLSFQSIPSHLVQKDLYQMKYFKYSGQIISPKTWKSKILHQNMQCLKTIVGPHESPNVHSRKYGNFWEAYMN